MTLKEYRKQLETIHIHQGVERSYYTSLHHYLKEFFASLNTSPQFIIEGSVRPLSSDPQAKMFPDFQILNEKSTGLIGLIEAKSYKSDISYLTSGKDRQIKKYLAHQPNLIVTNFDRFTLLSSVKDKNNQDKIVVVADHSLFEETDKTHALLERFITTNPNMNLGAFDIFSKTLAYYANKLEVELHRVMIKELKKEDSLFAKFFYKVLRGTLRLTNQEESNFAHSLIESYVFYQIFNQQLSIKIDILEEMVEAFLKKGIASVNDEKLNYEFQCLENFLTKANQSRTVTQAQFQQWVYQYKDNQDNQTLFTYFYEHFLTMWEEEINKDHKGVKQVSLRKDLGVYYTPKPVVSFMVNAVNTILQKEFHFTTKPEQGLGSKQVQLLDFATGTGTFLLEALEQTFYLLGSRTAKQQEEDILSMIDRFYGFEIMITPWVLAKYNVRQKIHELLGNNNFDINTSKIYLTNTLEYNSLTHKLELSLIEKFSQNIVEANTLKASKDIFVIIGNPPYNKGSKNKIRAKQKHIKEDADYNTFLQIETLLQDYKPIGEKKINITDDYVKFIRWAHHKIVQHQKGIVAVITPHSFLSGATYRAMRNQLMEDFNYIYILNLHGNNNTKRYSQDSNVFNIQTGVAITILVKTHKATTKERCTIHYQEVIGSREEKFTRLESGFSFIEWQRLDPLALDAQLETLRWGKRYHSLRFFVPQEKLQPDLISYGQDSWGITDIFIHYASGVETKYDEFAISFSQAEAEEKIDLLLSSEHQKEVFTNQYPKRESESWQYTYVLKEAQENYQHKPYRPITYRPFDTRIVWYTAKQGIVARPRNSIMQHSCIPNNIYLVFTRFTNKNYYRHIFISNHITDSHFINDWGYTAPLYLLAHPPVSSAPSLLFLEQEQSHQLNFTPEFMQFFMQLQAQWSTEVVTPEAIFAYIYAVLSTPIYQTRYNALLSLDFPRILFTKNAQCFSQMAALGQHLINAHTMQASTLQQHTRSDDIFLTVLHIQEDLDALADDAKYIKIVSNTIIFDNKQTLTIPLEHLNYVIGSYTIIKTYINNRKSLPMKEYRKDLWNVIVAIDLSLLIEKKLDKIMLKNLK